MLGWDGRVVHKDWLSVDLTYNQAMALGEQDFVKNAEPCCSEFLRRQP